MNRQVARVAGVMLLIGLGGWSSQAFSQGPMAPRPPDVRVAPPPVAAPPPVVAPPPMAPAMAPTMAPIPTAPAPATRTTTRGPAGGPPPFTDGRTTALPGIGVTIWSAGGQRQVMTDKNGGVSLGKLPEGVHELTVSTRNVGPGGNPAVPATLVALLLPAVQSAREAAPGTMMSVRQVGPGDLRIRVGVGPKGDITSALWMDGPPPDWVPPYPGAPRLKAFEESVRGGTPGEIKLAFARIDPVSPAPQSQATASTAPAPLPSKLDALTDGLIILRFVGATATGPGGTAQTRSDGEGWTRFGKLPVGNTVIEFKGGDMVSALKATGEPTTPTAQKFRDHIVVIAIIAIKTDGTPVVFTASLPANDVKTLKADLRVGRDGNAMEVNWGNGPQLPQALPRSGAATLTVPGPNGPVPVSPAFVKSLQDRAGKSAPGMVDANSALQEVSTTR